MDAFSPLAGRRSIGFGIGKRCCARATSAGE